MTREHAAGGGALEPPPPEIARAARLIEASLACVLLGAAAAASPLLCAAPPLRPFLFAAPPLLAACLLLAGPLAAAQAAAAARRSAAPRAGIPARSGQLVLVAPPAIAAAWLALRSTAAPPPALAAAVAATVFAFALLVLERHLAAADPRALPEAPALRRLALLATLTAGAAAIAAAAAVLALPGAPLARALAAVPAGLTAIELAARAAGRLYLPPPSPAQARGVARSSLALLVARLLRAEPPEAGPIRAAALDFSRSWALAFLRAAVLPAATLLLLAAWGLSGLVLVPLDGRRVYQRLGAPVAVLHPGLHVILPWPLGLARPVEFGTLHQLALGPGPNIGIGNGIGTGTAPAAPDHAEDPDPASADRLWDQPHPGELSLVVASIGGAGQQLFQSVSADLLVIWRVGLTDRDAVRATYGSADPAALLRALAAQTVAASFAGRTLDAVLGADCAALGETMRASLQRALDDHRTGLEVVAFIVEAIHPPAGAADAYHAVRAAEINADAAIYAERGRALTVRAQSRQYEFEQTASAAARAAEIDGAARQIAIRFRADQDAARIARPFLFERYLASLTQAVGRAPVTIVDSRLLASTDPTIDLRPMPGATPSIADGE